MAARDGLDVGFDLVAFKRQADLRLRRHGGFQRQARVDPVLLILAVHHPLRRVAEPCSIAGLLLRLASRAGMAGEEVLPTQAVQVAGMECKRHRVATQFNNGPHARQPAIGLRASAAAL